MINFEFNKIAPKCLGFGIELTDDIREKLNIYGNLLLEWNEKINLTAITEPDAVLYKHFLDCILFFKNVNVKNGASVADVGTGAGFPGMVLKIIRDDLDVTLIDSLNKRLIFLNEVIEKLSLSGIKTVHSRAEDAGNNKLFREKFDIVTARAVANLPVLLEYCTPLVKVGGIFVGMKGPSAEEEIKASANAQKLLSLGEPDIIFEELPENDKRAFITYKKISQTPPKYPRKPSVISKQPL